MASLDSKLLDILIELKQEMGTVNATQQHFNEVLKTIRAELSCNSEKIEHLIIAEENRNKMIKFAWRGFLSLAGIIPISMVYQWFKKIFTV